MAETKDKDTPFASSMAELFANCTDYNEKVDVIVDVLVELGSDAVAKKVAKARATQKGDDARRRDEDDPNAASSAAVGSFSESNNPADQKASA